MKKLLLLLALMPFILTSCSGGDKEDSGFDETKTTQKENIKSTKIVVIPQENTAQRIGIGQIISITTDSSDKSFQKIWKTSQGDTAQGDTITFMPKNEQPVSVSVTITNGKDEKSITTSFTPQYCNYRYAFWGQKPSDVVKNETAISKNTWGKEIKYMKETYLNEWVFSDFDNRSSTYRYYFDDSNKLYRGLTKGESRIEEQYAGQTETYFKLIVETITQQTGIKPEELNIIYNNYPFSNETYPLTEYNLTYRQFYNGYSYIAKWNTIDTKIEARAESQYTGRISYVQIFEKK